jgi:hypothetical protein
MNVSLVVSSVLALLFLAPASSPAQYPEPAAVRRLDADPVTTASASPLLRPREDTSTLPRETSGPIPTLVGGFVGGVTGFVVGMAIAGRTARGCRGEFCGLGDYLLGITIGESVGLATGAHIASRSRRHEHIIMTTLSSAGILVGGGFVAAALGQWGLAPIMIPMVPVLQLAAAAMIESH